MPIIERQIHQQERKVIQNVAGRDQWAEFDRIEQNRGAVDQNDIAEVQIAMDGREALHRSERDPHRFDMAIIDIEMPQMGGMELLRQLREQSDLPVILLTSKRDEADELHGLTLGADDCVRKPFSRRVLIERIKVLLRRKRSGPPEPAKATGAVECGNLRMDADLRTCTWKGSPVPLTAKP